MDPHPLGLILFHKQSTSARVRFLRSAGGSICFGSQIPKLATLVDENNGFEKEQTLARHPAMAVRELEKQMGLETDAIQLDKNFRARVDMPGHIMPVYLAQFKNIDPPFEAAEKVDAKFIAITEARRQPPIELQLLQKAYEYIMG